MPKTSRRGRHSRISKHEPLITYPDASGLDKFLEVPQSTERGTLAFAIAAGVIGVIILVSYIVNVVAEPMRQQEELQNYLRRDVSLDLPYIPELMPLDDGAIMQTLTDRGFTLYEQKTVDTSANAGFEVVKLPPDVSLDDAAFLYAQGVGNLSAANAVKLLKGSWMLTVNRTKATEIRVRYADFSSGSPEGAIQAAMAAERIDSATIGETGEDDVGNTFATGLITTETGTYTWRVSALPLIDVYDEIRNLPNTAQYVGIRYTQ